MGFSVPLCCVCTGPFNTYENGQEIETIRTAIGAGQPGASARQRRRTGTASNLCATGTAHAFEGRKNEMEEIVQATFGCPGADGIGFGCLGNVRAALAHNDGRTGRC